RGVPAAIVGMLDRLMPEMERRAGIAHAMVQRTITDQSEAWELAAARLTRDPRFPGVGLLPQEGLIPLGPDPDSGLEEFVVDQSGTTPIRDPVTRRFRIRPEHGFVLVLIPGGSVWIGAQRSDPDGRNYDPTLFSKHAGPPFQVQLDPYLIGKYEATQAQ
ncbi:MAG: hypothetical protein ACJAQ3_004361, partial [Planctomycetota bacterium]